MLGTVQEQEMMFPILLLNEGLASFDPFAPPIYLPISLLANYGQSEAFVGLQTMPQTRCWVKALFFLLFS